MTQNSHEQLRESLSALVDNQASELELRRLLKHSETDESLAASWQRYHLAGEILRGTKPAGLNIDLRSAVAAAIAQEVLPEVRVNRGWQAWMGKSALAASVALAVLVGVKQYSAGPEVSAPIAVTPSTQVETVAQANSREGTEVAPLVAEAPTAQTAPAGFALPVPDARTVSSNGSMVRHRNPAELQPMVLPNQNWRNDAALQQELNQLLIDHAARASGNGSMGILPFARVSSMNNIQE